MKYLTPQDILILHARVIEETGGLHGVRDVGLLSSAVERPKMRFGGKELYKGVFAKAAAYFESIIKNHEFIDGNKRTGILAAARFLFLNGYELMTTNKEMENFALKVATYKMETLEITVWFKKHAHRLKK